jgi:hypothetical protein
MLHLAGLRVRIKFRLFLAVAIVLMVPALAHAVTYSDAQLKRILEGSAVYATGGICRTQNDPLGTVPTIKLKFEKSGKLDVQIECINLRDRVTSTDSNAAWRLNGGKLCIRGTDPIFLQSLPAHGENCMPAQETRFGFELIDDEGDRIWFFQVEQHPVYGSQDELLAALKTDRPAPVTAEVAAPPAPQPVIQPAVQSQQAVQQTPQQPSSPGISRAAADSAMWDEIKFSSRVSDFQRYLAAYPNGLFVQLADNQIRSLITAQAQSHAVANTASQTVPISDIEFGDYHALVIGINNYKYINKLGTAVSDAKSVAALLKNQYGFKVRTLIDPDRAGIIDAFDEYRESLSETDNLLIYYAGHGWLDDETSEGYWLSVKARSNRKSQWVSNSTITKSLKALPAKHVMVVADSCFSGTLTRAADISFRDKGYLKRMARKRARVAMVSGGLEPVADDSGSGHSPFANAFMDALKKNPGVIDGTRLFSEVRRPVTLNARQTPEYSDVRDADHDGGDFLFVRKR